MAIRLIVGLGNPGLKYQDTRHNAGFWLVESLANASKEEISWSSNFGALLVQVKIEDQKIWLAKPQTFMNCSGRSVSTISNFYKICLEDILVVHDELGLLSGSIKLKEGGSSGGHNGLRDITGALGSSDYWRLRIGIGHPRTLGYQQKVADFVLQNPSRDEKDCIEQAIRDGVKMIHSLCCPGC